VIEHWAPPAPPPKTVQAAPVKAQAPPQADMEKLTCIACKTVMRVPKATLAGDKPVNVRCPNPDCGKVLKITPKKPKPPKPDLASE